MFDFLISHSSAFNRSKQINKRISKMNKLPRDVVLKIISYLDIDTRRSMGIISKLNIPCEIKSTLQAVTPHPRRLIYGDYSRVSLGPLRTTGFMYVIDLSFGMPARDSVFVDGCSFLGHNWYHPCVLHHDYKRLVLSSPLVMEYVRHNSSIQNSSSTIYIMQSNKITRDILSCDVYLRKLIV